MLVNQQFAVWQVGIILSYVAVLVGCSGCVRDFVPQGVPMLALLRGCAPEEFYCYRHTILC